MKSSIEHLVLHIGSDKAGSSAIQESLVTNHDWYANRGVFIPQTGITRAAGHPHLFNGLDDPEMRQSLIAEARAARQPTAVLSWEGVHFFDDGPRKVLRDLLDKAFPDARLTIVYYVRNQVDLVQTGVLQRIKQQTLTPSAVADLNRPLAEIPLRSRKLLDGKNRYYTERISAWERTFPKATLEVRLYDRDRLLNRDIIDDFNQVLGLETDGECARATRSANTSLCAEAAVVLAGLTNQVWDEDDQRRLIDSVLGFKQGTTAFLHDDVRDSIVEQFADDNAALVERFPHCAGIEKPHSLPRPGLDPDTIAACERFLLDQLQFPTLLQGRLRGTDLGRVNLVEGWAEPNDRGVWTAGPRSVLRFRPRGMHFTGFTKHVALEFAGKYSGGYRASHVTVNGHDMGEIDLLSTQLLVDIDMLDATYNIELTLEHPPPKRVRPRGVASTDANAFLIRLLAYSVE
ncbi:MAG: hypothetical protein HKN26_08120 [Acidimicrobiales bacterium]|nr:hypothetical protein [Acidimicrobiales bacterium]